MMTSSFPFHTTRGDDEEDEEEEEDDVINDENEVKIWSKSLIFSSFPGPKRGENDVIPSSI